MSIDETVARLVAIEEIHQLKARYCRLLDEKNWAELSDVFAEYAHIETDRGLSGGAQHTFDDSSSFIAHLQRLMQPIRSVHHVHAPEITMVSADSASGIWAVADHLSVTEGRSFATLQGYGHYREKYSRIDGRWLITDMRLSRLLVEVEPSDPPSPHR